MKPQNVPKYIDGENSYQVNVVVTDFNGMAIGTVEIDGVKQYVIRWNYGIDDERSIGFPQSRGTPVWLLLAKGIKLSIEL